MNGFRQLIEDVTLLMEASTYRWNINQKHWLDNVVARLRNRAGRPPYSSSEILDWFSDFDPYENLADLAQPTIEVDGPGFDDLWDAADAYVLGQMGGVAEALGAGEEERERLNALIRSGVGDVPGKFWISYGALGGLVVNWAGVPPDAAGLAVDNAPSRLMLVVHGLSDQEKRRGKPLEVAVVQKYGLRNAPGIAGRRGGALEQVAAHCARLVSKASATFGG